MDNIQPPQTTNPIPPASDVPNLPAGTYEYIDANKKRNWKKIFEISLLCLIAGVPLLLSLFQFDYSVKRVYEVVNPAYVGTTSSYDGWSGIITAAKNIIAPIQKSENTEQTPIQTPQLNEEILTPTSPPSSPQQQTTEQNSNTWEYQEQTNYSQQTEEQPSSIQQEAVSPSQEVVTSPAQTFEEQPAQNNEQISPSISPSIYSAEAVCVGKRKEDQCWFISNEHIFSGKCKNSSNNHLTCVAL